MAYTAIKLITNAYYLSGIVARTLQSVSGEQLADGLDLLNALLAVKSIHQTLIPYYQEVPINAVVGQEKYLVANLLNAETLTFYIDSVRYSMIPVSRDVYFGSARADNIQSLPFSWHMERCKGGAIVYIHFSPDTAYPMKLWGKLGLTEIATENTDLLLTYDHFYIEYMRYALAEYICSEYNISLQPQSQKKLDDIEAQLKDVSPIDLRITKFSTLTNETGINYGDVNLSRGWRP